MRRFHQNIIITDIVPLYSASATFWGAQQTTTKMSSPLENLETQLEMFIENVRQVRIIVSDFQPQGQNVLNQKMYVFFVVYFAIYFSTA